MSPRSPKGLVTLAYKLPAVLENFARPREMESEVLDARTRRLQEKHRVMIVVGRRTHEAARAGEVVGDAKAEG